MKKMPEVHNMINFESAASRLKSWPRRVFSILLALLTLVPAVSYPKQPLTSMDEATHRALHKDMNDFLRTKTDEFGNHMRPQRGNSGRDIQQNFTREQCIGALCDFYRGPGAKYEDAARDFIKQHPGQ